MTVKKLIGQLHLWLGLASGLVVLVVTLTGSIMVFEKEIDEYVNRDFYFTKAPSATNRLTVDSLLNNARQYDASMKITGIELDTHAADRSVLFRAKKNDHTWYIAVDPYTGKTLGAIDQDSRFFTIVLHLHRYLLAGDAGKIITGISCLIFLTLILTGLVLWWPKRIKMLKQRLKIKWPASGKRFNWDLHAVGGFYVHLVIFTIALTGLTWSYKWFNNAIFLAFDGKPQKKYEAPANRHVPAIANGYFEKVYQETNRLLAYRGAVNFNMSGKDSLAITVSKENLEASIPNVVDFLYFDRSSGQLLKERLYAKESTGTKVRRAILPIHSGSIYGWPTKLLAFFSCVVAFSLPITGLRIWLGRKKKKRVAAKRAATHTNPTPASAAEERLTAKVY